MQFKSWPIVDDEHVEAVERVVRSGRWHYGSIHQDLERDLETEYGRHAVTTTSCAWAIYLTIRALGRIKTVAVPAFTYYGTVHPVIWGGASPVFVDVDPATFNMCPDDLRKTLKTQRIDAVLGVHLHGLPFDPAIGTICKEQSLPLIEDVCQAQGASVSGQKAGTLGAAAALSFNSRKTMPAGLGGAALFENSGVAQRAREIRDYGRRNTDGTLDEIGSYLPIGEFDAAIVRIQLPRLPKWISHAGAMADILSATLGARAPRVPVGHIHAWHKYRIRGTTTEKERLDRLGVITSIWMKHPLTQYPAYAPFVTTRNYPGAESIVKETFCLFDDERPIVAQTSETIHELANVLKNCLS